MKFIFDQQALSTETVSEKIKEIIKNLERQIDTTKEE